MYRLLLQPFDRKKNRGKKINIKKVVYILPLFFFFFIASSEQLSLDIENLTSALIYQQSIQQFYETRDPWVDLFYHFVYAEFIENQFYTLLEEAPSYRFYLALNQLMKS